MSSNWSKRKLSDIATMIDYRGKTPRKTKVGIPLITAKIVKNGTILPVNEFIAEEDYTAWMTRGLPMVGDVVVTTEAPLGEVAQLRDAHVALAQRIITIRGKAGMLDNAYLKYFFLVIIVNTSIVILAVQIIIGKASQIDQPLYPIIMSNNITSIEFINVCNNTCEAIFTVFFIEYITVIQVYTMPKITIYDHLKFGVHSAFIITLITHITSEIIVSIFNTISLVFIFIMLGYKFINSITFYFYFYIFLF